MTGRTVSDYARRYVRDRAQAHMNCTIILSRHRDGLLDPDSGLYTADTGKVIYRGKARIWDSTTGAIINVGEADLATTATYCSIPFDSEMPRVDDLIRVISAPVDGALESRGFRVMNVDGGGLIRATRRMQITALAENRSWRPDDIWEN